MIGAGTNDNSSSTSSSSGSNILNSSKKSYCSALNCRRYGKVNGLCLYHKEQSASPPNELVKMENTMESSRRLNPQRVAPIRSFANAPIDVAEEDHSSLTIHQIRYHQTGWVTCMVPMCQREARRHFPFCGEHEKYQLIVQREKETRNINRHHKNEQILKAMAPASGQDMMAGFSSRHGGMKVRCHNNKDNENRVDAMITSKLSAAIGTNEQHRGMANTIQATVTHQPQPRYCRKTTDPTSTASFLVKKQMKMIPI